MMKYRGRVAKWGFIIGDNVCAKNIVTSDRTTFNTPQKRKGYKVFELLHGIKKNLRLMAEA